jgi:PAS domain S-box-containing protein
METMLEATDRLRASGFTTGLSALPSGRVRCGACGRVVDAALVTVLHTVRFEGDSNPDDEEILVAGSMPCGHRGLFSAAYGPSLDAEAGDVLRVLGSRSARPAEAQDQGGDPPCWAHLDSDATEELSDSDLGALVRSMADAVVVADRDGTVVFWNEAATRIFGWTADQMRGRPLDAIVPDRLRARHRAGYHRTVATGHTDYGGRLLQVPATHRDGRTISIAFTVSLLRRGGDDRVTGIVAVIRDETERWQERQHLLRQLADLPPDSNDPP